MVAGFLSPDGKERDMNPLLFQSPREVMRDFPPDPDNRPVNPADVDQALEHRRHVNYRNHMLKLRLHAELKVFRLGLVSAEHRLLARLQAVIHPHSRTVAVHSHRQTSRTSR
jgi:hypothetical protein